MSLYSCIDLIDTQLKKSGTKDLNLLERVGIILSNKLKEEYAAPSPADIELMTILKEKLSHRALEDNYIGLEEEIELIKEYVRLNESPSQEGCLLPVLADLVEIQRRFDKINQPNKHSPPNPAEYRKFQTPEYRIAQLDQNESYRLGTSLGECYGFTYAMVDPGISPYKNSEKVIDLNQQIYNYQKNQIERNLDQGQVKRIRLTREHFCPNPRQQAEEILLFAEQNEEKELSLHRRSSVGLHASYISKQSDGKIRYMDPNHGVYLFKNQNDFIEFYIAAAQKDKQMGVDFHFYSLSQLQWDPDNQLSESISIMGKIRSLLTGSKYQDGAQPSTLVNQSAHFLAGAAIGAIIGGAVGSVLPIIGTTFGAAIGAMVGGIALRELSNIAKQNGHRGLLGIPHYIQDSLYQLKEDFKEKLSNLFSSTPKDSYNSGEEKNKEIDADSTRTMTILMNKNCAASKEKTASKLTEAQSKEEISASNNKKHITVEQIADPITSKQDLSQPYYDLEETITPRF